MKRRRSGSGPAGDNAPGLSSLEAVAYVSLYDLGFMPERDHKFAVKVAGVTQQYNIERAHHEDGEIILELGGAGRTMNIGVQIDAETMEWVEAMLAQVPKGAERAFSNAINRGLSKVKTGAFREVKRVYTVQSSALSGATSTNIKKASTGDLAGHVHFAGYEIPLYKFNVTPKKPGTGKQVSATMKRGGGAVYDDAFIAEMKSGHIGVFHRETRKHLPISEYMGLSAAHMVGETAVAEKLQEEAQKTVDERVMHEVERLLNGYGG